MKPELVQASWDYFKTVQTANTKYEPLLRPGDQPAIDLNKESMARYREQMKKYLLRLRPSTRHIWNS